jgi:RNA polymerase sigma-70 factor (ECF subfamily)
MTDADRFEVFVRTYQDMVFATAVRLLGNPAEAEDVAQAVFLRAFQRFDDLAASPAVTGWLRTVARNLCLNHLSRYRARWQLFSELAPENDDGQGGIRSEPDVAASPEAAIERAEDQERLERALAKLPDHQRVPIVLFHFENMSYQEIADALGIAAGKVKTDIHRGRQALKRELLGYGPR